VAFGDRFTNVTQYLKKGQMIGVSGSLQTHSWEDNEGKKHYRTEVKVNELTLLGNGNGNGNGNAGGNGSAGATADQTTGAGDEIPF
jgi:single-strand DNA-binding protein